MCASLWPHIRAWLSRPHQDPHGVINSGFFVLSDSLSGIQKATGSTHPQQHRHKIGSSGCLNQLHAGVGVTKVRSCWSQNFKALYPPEKRRCFLVVQPKRGSSYPFMGRRESGKQNPNPYPLLPPLLCLASFPAAWRPQEAGFDCCLSLPSR